ncbi:MAG: TPM domain-containing protein [Ignavibacteria bacterium]|nr:TPM domain-containing protein [Ignavibacteria bacterium]
MQEQLIYNFFDDDEFLRISNKIKEMEKKTAGEIRVSIKEKKSFFQRNKTLKLLAEEEFFRLGMNKTSDKTGILIFLLIKERQFYILADKGIDDKVEPATWNSIKDKMQDMFSKGEFSKGILFGIEEVGKILSSYFPLKADDKDELSNRIIIN